VLKTSRVADDCSIDEIADSIEFLAQCRRARSVSTGGRHSQEEIRDSWPHGLQADLVSGLRDDCATLSPSISRDSVRAQKRSAIVLLRR